MLVKLKKGKEAGQLIAWINRLPALFNSKELRIKDFKEGDEVEVAVKRVVMAKDVLGRPIPYKPICYIIVPIDPRAVAVEYEGFTNRTSRGRVIATGEEIILQAHPLIPLQYRKPGKGMAVCRDAFPYKLVGVTEEEELYHGFATNFAHNKGDERGASVQA